MNGKGSSPRNCFSETYRENYDSIFRKNQTCCYCGCGVVETPDSETVKCPECGREQESDD